MLSFEYKDFLATETGLSTRAEPLSPSWSSSSSSRGGTEHKKCFWKECIEAADAVPHPLRIEISASAIRIQEQEKGNPQSETKQMLEEWQVFPFEPYFGHPVIQT
jgi:hypothetical protein